MKVALVAAPSLFLPEPKTFPPLGAMYLAASAKKCGFDVDVIDLTGEENYLEKTSNFSAYDVIAISATTPQFHYAVEMLNVLRRKQPKATIIIGGAHPSVEPQSCIRVGFDLAVAGEAEVEFPLILSRLENGWKPKGEIVYAQMPMDLDALPFPDRDCIKLQQYVYIIDGIRATSIITQRGCPYSCSFCCHWKGYNITRFRSSENVVEEIRHVKERYGYQAFMFWDDEFNLNQRRTVELCEALKSLDIKFRCFIRSNLFNMQIAKVMREAGCVEVGCGVESGSDKILQIINKRTTVKQNTLARRICREVGIRFKAFTILGLPYESKETAYATMNWLLDNQPDEFDVTIFTPYPGSKIWEHPQQFDVQFDKAEMAQSLFEESYYKGPKKSPVSTSQLSAEEIVNLRDEIEDKCGRKIKSRWLWEKKEEVEGFF